MKEEIKKYILFSGFNNEEVKKIITCIKNCSFYTGIIFATTTETTMEWTVKEWLEELSKEDESMRRK